MSDIGLGPASRPNHLFIADPQGHLKSSSKANIDLTNNKKRKEHHIKAFMKAAKPLNRFIAFSQSGLNM